MDPPQTPAQSRSLVHWAALFFYMLVVFSSTKVCFFFGMHVLRKRVMLILLLLQVKQDTEDYRVMYREGPEGTPFHTLLVEGYVDGPSDVCKID